MPLSQWLLLVFLSLLWGGSFLFVGMAVHELPPLTLVLGLTALRLIKGVLIALQYRNKAAEGRLDRGA